MDLLLRMFLAHVAGGNGDSVYSVQINLGHAVKKVGSYLHLATFASLYLRLPILTQAYRRLKEQWRVSALPF